MRNKYEWKSSSIKVFISSSMKNDLHMERRAAVHAFFERMPMYECFVIEETASPDDVETRYTDKVLWADIIILILSDTLSKAVCQEYQTALTQKKRIFTFINNGITDPELNKFIKSEIEKTVTYTTFNNLRDLIDKIEKSLLDDLALSYRKWIAFEAGKNKPYVDPV